MKKMTLRAIPALMLVSFSGLASASAFQLWEQNASGIGTAYAGSAAVADNASTIYFNPAGMTLLPGRQVSLGISAVRPSFEFRDENSRGTGIGAPLMAVGGNGGDAGGWSAIPNAYVSWQVSPQWFIGLGISAPFGLATEYESDSWRGRLHSLKSEIKTVNVNPSVAYKLNDKVSLGFGINYQQIDAEMTNLTPVGPYRLKGDDAAWGWNAGALFTLSPAMRVGVSYRSAMDYHLDGKRTLAANTVDANANLKLPDTFILSVWQQVSDRWEAMGDLSFTNWSTLGKLNIKYATGTDVESFNYKDSWRFAWGAAYKASEEWKVKFGIAYDRTPTTNSDRSARVPDNNRIWLSIGGQWKPAKYSTLDFGYAYLYLKDPKIEQTRTYYLPGTSTVIGTATLDGRYSNSGHVLGIQYSHGF